MSACAATEMARPSQTQTGQKYPRVVRPQISEQANPASAASATCSGSARP